MSDETQPAAPARRTPKRIIAIVVLVYISGVLDIIGGVLLMLLRYADELQPDADRLVITLTGAGMALIGLLTIAMASGLTRGRPAARVFVSVLVVLSVLVESLDLASSAGGMAEIVSFSVGAAVALLILLALWLGKGAAHFRRSPELQVPST